MAVNNSLAKKPAKMGLTAYLSQDAVKKQINNVVGGKNGTRFISSIVSAAQATPALQECTNPSILSAALLGEALNLSPSPQLGHGKKGAMDECCDISCSGQAPGKSKGKDGQK